MESNINDEKFKHAYLICIEYLSRREYSQSELQYKLSQKGISDDIVETCLFQLKEEGLQSDQRFVEAFYRNRIQQRYGPRKIAHELKQRGISEDAIMAEQSRYQDTFIENTQYLIAKKSPRYTPTASLKDRQLKAKITRFLAGKGYDYDTINLAFECLADEQ